MTAQQEQTEGLPEVWILEISVKMIETVTGPVAAESLGTTLTHEHVLADLRAYWRSPEDPSLKELSEREIAMDVIGAARRNPFLIRDNLDLRDAQTAIAEVRVYRELGGSTLVDLTQPDLGRDISGLKVVAEATGVNIIAGCGHYLQMAHPASVASDSIDTIADRLILELTEGVGDTGIRPGIIGEIGMSNPIHPDEVKVLRAAARAHMATGTPIAVHLSPAPAFGVWTGHFALDVLESEGVSLDRVLICHLDNDIDVGPRLKLAVDYHRSLADRGCFLGYDGCGKEHYVPSGSNATFPNFWLASDRERCAAIAMLFQAGVGGSLMLSHDVCFKVELLSKGGFGYGHILRTFLDNLADVDVPRDISIVTLRDNPRRFFGS